nr:BRO family protein [uncultured Cohaesibacter sp.]
MQIDGDPWFVAANVCKVLDLHASVLRRLDVDQKLKLPRTQLGMRQGQPASVISESGLYKLVMRSDKPQAKKFQDWVTRDVLPTIRKTGQYNVHAAKVASGEMSRVSV